MAACVRSLLLAVLFSASLCAQSTDATLRDLKVNGTMIAGFSPSIQHYDYSVSLTGGTVAVPAITAATPNAATAAAVVDNSSSLVETARVTVTAPDGVTKKVYTVHYKPSLASAALDGIKNASHPRVYLNSARVLDLRTKITTSAYSGMWQELKAQADAILLQGKKTYVDVTASDPEELWQRTVGDNLTIVAFVWLMSQEQKYFDFAKDQALIAITYPHWGTTPDLAAGHLLGGVGTVYDWFYANLTSQERSTLANALIAQGNRMYDGATLSTGAGGGQWWQDDYMQNHLWVSIGGLNIAGMAVIDESNKTTVSAWLRVAMDKFSRTMYYLGDDGASHEGPSYWNYGVEHFFKFADLSKTYYKYNAFEHLWFAGTGDYKISMLYPRNSWTPLANNQNFGGDAEIIQWGGPDYLFRKLAAEYAGTAAGGSADSRIYQWYADQVDNAGIENPLSRWLNILWFNPNVSKLSPYPTRPELPTFQYFADMGIASMRTDWSGNESVVNFKSGPFMGKTVAESGATYDLGAGHVQPDINHFTIFGAGEWQIRDDGYAYKITSNHNTLLTNPDVAPYLSGQMGEGGHWFSPGPLIAANTKPTMSGVYSLPDYDVVRGDGAAAYASSKGINQYKRHLIFLKKANILIVVDDLALTGSQMAELRFFPQSQTIANQVDGGFFAAGQKSNLRIVPLTPSGTSASQGLVDYATREGLGHVIGNEVRAIRIRKQGNGSTWTWRNATAFVWSSNENPALKKVKLVQDLSANKWKFYTSDNVLVQFDWNSASYGNTAISNNVPYPASNGTDASIAGLFVGDQSQSITANQTRYDIAFAGNARIVPTVVVAPKDPEATVSVTQAISLPGTAVATVRSANNGTEVTYTINLRPSDFNADGSLAVAQVASTAVPDPTNAPEKVIDGIDTDLNGYWGSNAAAVGGTASLTLDLGRVKSVNRVDISWRPANSRAYIYSVQTSTDNVNWTTVVPSKTSAVATTLPQYQADSFNAVSARYVRINGTDNTKSTATTKWITICEVKLWGAGAPSQNLAAGKTVAYSASHNDVVPSRLTNGLSSGSATDLVAVGAAASLVSATVDLGQLSLVDRIKMWHYYADNRTYRDVIVQLSPTSGFTGGVTTVFNNDADNTAGLGSGTDAEYQEMATGKEVVIQPVQARYVRFYIRGNTVHGWNHYVELQAFGYANAMPIVNAGSDQTIHIPAGTLSGSATLTGSATDSNNDALTYTWTGIFGTATGTNPTVNLPLGANKIRLHVSDGKTVSTDEVIVTVVTP